MYFDSKPGTHCNTLMQQIAFLYGQSTKLHKFTAAVRHSNKFHSTIHWRILMKILTVMTQTKSNQFDFVQPVAQQNFISLIKLLLKFNCSHH